MGGENTHRRYAFDALGNVSHDFLLAARAFFPRCQRQDNKAVIGRPAGTCDGISSNDFTAIAQRLDGLLNLVKLRLEELHTDALRPIDTQQCNGTIFRGRQFLTDQTVADKGCACEKHCHQHNNEWRRQTDVQRLFIEGRKPAADTTQEKRAMAAVFAIPFLEEARGKHGAKRQRNNR